MDRPITATSFAIHEIKRLIVERKLPAGQKIGHSFLNSGSGPCAYLMIGERNPNDVCVYPDSNKVSSRWLGERYDRAAQEDYWVGEA